MLLLEIPLVAQAGRIFERLGPRLMIAGATTAGGLRWVATAHTSDLSYLYPIQMLHSVVVAGLILGAPIYVETLIPVRLRSTGQALVTTFGAGLGGIVSTVSAGALFDGFGIDAVYWCGGLGGLFVALSGRLLLRPYGGAAGAPDYEAASAASRSAPSVSRRR